MSGYKTYYALKWFYRVENTTTETVGVMDERHPQHNAFVEAVSKPSAFACGHFHLPSYIEDRCGPVEIQLPAEGGKLVGMFSGERAEYPDEPNTRLRDPNLPKGEKPELCKTGWHVPFVQTLAEWTPSRTAELWLVKVGGIHAPLDSRLADNKMSFATIELRKQLTLSDAVDVLSAVAKKPETAVRWFRQLDSNTYGYPGRGQYVLLNRDSIIEAEA